MLIICAMLHINTADQLFKPYRLYKHVITPSTENTELQVFLYLFCD